MRGPTVVLRMSPIRNMNFSCPSRRAMTELSDTKMVRARCLGWLMRAKMTPSTIASSSWPHTLCATIIHAEIQQSAGALAPKPAVGGGGGFLIVQCALF